MKTIQQRFQIGYSYPVAFTHDVFDVRNPVLPQILKKSGQARCRVLTVIDSGVHTSTPGLEKRIARFVRAHQERMELVCPPLIMKGGETCKRDPREMKRVTALIAENHICRHSFVLVIGGGAVLDAAGFAAGIAHRGIRQIRMPTTTLSQQDAGVGVKNGINAFGRKNFLGSFAPPFAVINDFDFLKTLSPRHLRAGLAEAVKVALVKDRFFFELLFRNRARLARLEPRIVEKVIFRCAALHLAHIAASGDPFEFGSSRPLDFGHWSAHKLEEMTKGRLNHGEAVAIGLALDAIYSHVAGYLAKEELIKILTLLKNLGFTLYHPALSRLCVKSALNEFQEHLGGRLTIPLLKEIGRKIEIHEIHIPLMEQGIRILSEKDDRNRRYPKSPEGPEPSEDVFYREPAQPPAVAAIGGRLERVRDAAGGTRTGGLS